jgi:hypothetical protein
VAESVLAVDKAGDRTCDPPLHPLAPAPSLRLGRSQTTVTYVYRLPAMGADCLEPCTQALLSTWNQPEAAIAGQLPALIRTHTAAQALPPGQILLVPQGLALALWLRALITTPPAQPHPGPVPLLPAFPTQRARLAQQLQLSPLAVVQYTHMRCHRLANQAVGLASPDPGEKTLALPAPEELTWVCDRDRRVLRALVKLVDHLAVRPRAEQRAPDRAKSLTQGWVAGYDLCEAVDPWLGEITLDTTFGFTLDLLRGVERGLGHLLRVELQVPDPLSL